jgi:hypothetical protein
LSPGAAEIIMVVVWADSLLLCKEPEVEVK